MNANDIDAGYYDPADDRYNIQKPNDTRKPSITLFHLNKLKKMRLAKDLENLMRGDMLEILYGTPSDETGGI